MGRVERTRELARRRTRRDKIKKLRQKYAQARNEGDKVDIANKLRQISPFCRINED